MALASLIRSMRCLHAIEDLGALEGPLHLAIGVFDGVHLGHRAVLNGASERASKTGGTAVAVTFDPHPAEVLAPDKAPSRLTPLAHQQVLFGRLGLRATLAIPFDRAMANQTAEDFLKRLLGAGRLGSIHVGEDWSFGKGREGNVERLHQWGARYGFEVEGVPAVTAGGERISSSRVRRAVAQGELDVAQTLLGRPFSLFGEVCRGKQLGRELGFPTANVDFRATVEIPYGVYAVTLPSHGQLPGVANLGVRPSVDGGRKVVLEVHLIDWEGSLYGECVEVNLGHFLRPERRFDQLSDLKDQIGRDLEVARKWHDKAE